MKKLNKIIAAFASLALSAAELDDYDSWFTIAEEVTLPETGV